MAGPIRPQTPQPIGRPAAGAPQQPPAAGRGAGQALAGPPGLGRPPVQGAPAGGAAMRRAALPSTSRASTSAAGAPRLAGHAGASSSSALPPPAGKRLRQAAERLAGLEARRQELQAQLDAARQVRRENIGRQGSTELRRLQDRVDRAAAQLQRLHTERTTHLGRLEKAERALESCERSLEALSIDDTPPPAPTDERTAPAATTRPLAPQEAASAERFQPTQEEAAAQRLVQQLTNDFKKATRKLDEAKQVLEGARKDVDNARQVLQAVVDPETCRRQLDRAATTGVAQYLATLGLPAVDQPPASGPDTRFDAYIEQFSEVGPEGTRRLRAEFQEPRAALAAYSAAQGALVDNRFRGSLLSKLLPIDLTAIGASLRNGGNDLEAIVRPMVTAGMAHEVGLCERVVTAADNSRGAVLPRRAHTSGGALTRSEVMGLAERYRVLVQLLQDPAHRAAILEGAIEQVCSMLRSIALPAQEQAAQELAAAEERLKQAKAGQRPALQGWVDAERALNQATEEHRRLTAERRQRQDAAGRQAAEPAQARAPGASITQTEVASSSGGDAEARKLKLRGDIEKHTETVGALRQQLAGIDAQIQQAQDQLRQHEDDMETGAGAQARGRAGARRQHQEQRHEVQRLRRELDAVQAEVRAATTALDQDPARRSLISDRAWERAVARHVEPSDADLRDRIRAGETSHTGAYTSRSELAVAIAEIHAGLSQDPLMQAVLAARTRADFLQAAAAVPGGLRDRLHDHGREVGRGFSNAPDRTTRPTPTTQSSYSIDFVQGRALVTHLYPYVPHRQLATT